MKSQNNNPPSPDQAIGPCQECGGTGGVDSGGTTPWGASISLPCPSCNAPATAPQPEVSEPTGEQLNDAVESLMKDSTIFPILSEETYTQIAKHILSHTATLRATVADLNNQAFNDHQLLFIRTEERNSFCAESQGHSIHIVKLLERVRELEKSEDQLVGERDDAHQALSQAYYLVIGESPEWSNLFGYSHATNDIDEAQTLLRQEIKAARLEADGHAKRIVELLEDRNQLQEWLKTAQCESEKLMVGLNDCKASRANLANAAAIVESEFLSSYNTTGRALLKAELATLITVQPTGKGKE